MKTYHFKTDEQSDVRGAKLASLAAVKCEAAKIAASLACASADDPWHKSEWTVTVTDDHGQPVLQLKIIGSELLEHG
jgi:uncharacterized protein DUF6894